MGHENKCATPHGHNYTAWVYAEADDLDDLGRVIDFSVLKEKIGGWIDREWDHTFLVYEKDIDTIKALKLMPRKKPDFICPFNPTAENMADYLLDIVCPSELKGTGVTVTKIKLYETENCFAEAELAKT
jgi:6-pyruvoyltetrahydropterin/6-carboxytetrahydropterin synthase